MNIQSHFDLNDDVVLIEEDKRGPMGSGTVVAITCNLRGIFVSVAWGRSGLKDYRRTVEHQSHLRRA